MLCEKCNQNQATTYYKQNINGQTKEMYLCSECAEKFGVTSSPFPGYGFLFPSFISPERNLRESKKCVCGTTFSQIAKTGFVGCAKCYETFSDELSAVISKTHGGRRHIPRKETNPDAANKSAKDSIEDLKAALEKAIKEENFEQAVILRDRIKELDKKNKAE